MAIYHFVVSANDTDRKTNNGRLQIAGLEEVYGFIEFRSIDNIQDADELKKQINQQVYERVKDTIKTDFSKFRILLIQLSKIS